jgi:hypothetical protein
MFASITRPLRIDGMHSHDETPFKIGFQQASIPRGIRFDFLRFIDQTLSYRD